MKEKILVITGTRAEYGLLRPTLKAILQSNTLQLKLLVTGMHVFPQYGETIKGIRKDRLPISYVVPITQNGEMLDWLTQEVTGIKEVCLKDRPRLILVLGDRDEPLAGALIGAHLGIPVAHIHGGDVTGDVTVDDRIRDAITSFSSLHFPVSKKSAIRIKKILGHKAKNIYVVGQVGSEGINDIWPKKYLATKYHLSPYKHWIIFIMHSTPLENISPSEQVSPALHALKKLPAEIIGVYPNNDTGSEIFIKEMNKSSIFKLLISSIPRKDYLSFMKHCQCIVGNSSSAILEAPYFGTYVVNIGRRQQNRGNNKFMTTVPYETRVIRRIVVQYLNLPKLQKHIQIPTSLPSQLIVSYIESYLNNEKI